MNTLFKHLLVVLLVVFTTNIQANGVAGTTLSGYKTAAGFFERTNFYDWTLEKTASPTSVILDLGQSSTINYTLLTARNLSSVKDVYGARGEICVTNGGDRPTEGLAILDVVQTKVGAGPFQNTYSFPIDVSVNPVLDPLESYCYPYEVKFTPVPNAQYKNVGNITITNHSGFLGTPFGPSPKITFTIPSTPTIVNKDLTANLSDLLSCPVGFSCVLGDTGPWNLTDPSTIAFDVTITNNNAACESTFILNNTATLIESDSGDNRESSAQVVITTKACLPVITGCTLTQGYWKNHSDKWSADNLNLGNVNYLKPQLLDILNQSVVGNGLVSLSHQLIATKLNVLNGASTPASVANTITAADTLIGSLVVPPIGLGYLDPSVTTGYTSILDEFNNGNSEGGPPHCE